MKPFSQILQEDQRLVILRLLAEMQSYRSNSSVLAQALRGWGHDMSRDQVKAELRWLGDIGLVHVDDCDGALVVTLTETGADVAAGRTRRDGVKRPGPG